MTHQRWESIERSLAGLTVEERREVADWIMESIRTEETAADRVDRQRAALTDLCEKLDALPVVEQGDGLTDRDHDRVIYSP